MSTEEEQFLALLKENLRAHQNIASIVINYTCCSVHNVGTLNFTTDGGGRVAMRQSDAPQSQEVVTLPDELATDEAIHLWQKLQEADYIDENYQPRLPYWPMPWPLVWASDKDGEFLKKCGNAVICVMTLQGPYPNNSRLTFKMI